MSRPTPTILPIATIQNTFPDVLSEIHDGHVPSESVWLSCYKHDNPSVHGSIALALDDSDRDAVELSGKNGVDLTRIDAVRYRARCETLGVDTTFVVPSAVYADPAHSDERLPHQIPAFDVVGSTLVSGFTDGSASIYSIPPSILPKSPYPPCAWTPFSPTTSFKPHLASVTALRVLENPLRVVSAGADFRLCVAPLSDPSTRNMLTGHTRALTALITLADNGAATSARDGTVRVWDLRTGTQSAVLATAGMSVPLALDADGEQGILWAALADGRAQAFDVRVPAAQAVVEVEVGGSGSGLGAVGVRKDGTRVVLGGRDGVVTAWDVRAGRVQARWMRGGAPVEAVAFLDEERVVVGGEDGLPYVMRAGTDAPEVDAEVVFGDVEAVRSLRLTDGAVWMAGDGGVMRKYLFS